jgi:hypothetical protein
MGAARLSAIHMNQVKILDGRSWIGIIKVCGFSNQAQAAISAGNHSQIVRRGLRTEQANINVK